MREDLESASIFCWEWCSYRLEISADNHVTLRHGIGGISKQNVLCLLGVSVAAHLPAIPKLSIHPIDAQSGTFANVSTIRPRSNSTAVTSNNLAMNHTNTVELLIDLDYAIGCGADFQSGKF